ncbi:PH domain-containing protein [Kytococcus sp. Marseille-QA3725]
MTQQPTSEVLVADPGRPEVAVLEEPRHRVSERAPAYWRVNEVVGLVITAVIASGVLGTWWVLGEGAPPWWAWAIVGAILLLELVTLLVAPRLRYRWARWEATPDAVYTRRGWLSIERRMVPLARIQTVDVSRGPIMRHFDLTDVKITTASSAGDITIEALDDARAQVLLEQLTRAASAVRGDGT